MVQFLPYNIEMQMEILDMMSIYLRVEAGLLDILEESCQLITEPL
jgi:hypothetical protein